MRSLLALVVALSASVAQAAIDCSAYQGNTLPLRSQWIPTCPAGQVLTNSGNGLTCVAGGSGGGTGPAGLPATPVPCAVGTYVTAQEQNGNLTCSQVQWSQIDCTQPTVAN